MSNQTPKDSEEPYSNGTSGDIAVIGESSASTQVSLQTLQAIYNEITGKTEEIGKSYSKPIQIKFSDIEQLNHKITQACEQYNVTSGNCSATVYYVDDVRDQFSSFDRFRLHNAGSTSPVESVVLKYNFLIILPKTKNPQSYTVSVRLASRVAVAKRMRTEFYGAPQTIFRLMGNRTAVIEIKYIDYMVARNFLNLIDEWFKGIPTANVLKPLHWLQARSHLIPRVAEFATVLFVALLIVALLPTFVTKDSTDLLSFGRFLGYALLGTYAAYTLAGWSATFIEDSFDNYTELSYLHLTKGDELEISKARQRNKFAIVKSIGGIFLTICVSIVTKIVVNILVP